MDKNHKLLAVIILLVVGLNFSSTASAQFRVNFQSTPVVNSCGVTLPPFFLTMLNCGTTLPPGGASVLTCGNTGITVPGVGTYRWARNVTLPPGNFCTFHTCTAASITMTCYRPRGEKGEETLEKEMHILEITEPHVANSKKRKKKY